MLECETHQMGTPCITLSMSCRGMEKTIALGTLGAERVWPVKIRAASAAEVPGQSTPASLILASSSGGHRGHPEQAQEHYRRQQKSFSARDRLCHRAGRQRAGLLSIGFGSLLRHRGRRSLGAHGSRTQGLRRRSRRSRLPAARRRRGPRGMRVATGSWLRSRGRGRCRWGHLGHHVEGWRIFWSAHAQSRAGPPGRVA
jgi:hypothetical protein